VAVLHQHQLLQPRQQLQASGTRTSENDRFQILLSYAAPSSPGQAFAAWSKKVEEAGKGQIKITHYAAQTLAKQNENYDAITSGWLISVWSPREHLQVGFRFQR